jgi:hypothetical protein
MPSDCPCETLWIYNPTALVGTNLLVDDICESNNINAFTRAFLLGLVFALLLSPALGYGGFALVFLSLLFLYGRWIFAKIYPQAEIVEKVARPPIGKEGFSDLKGADILPGLKEPPAFPPIYTSPGVAVVTRPSAQNPFMNVLLDEIKYNPTRPPADFSTDPNNQVILDDFFRVQWNSDPTDVFGRSQGQRQFYTMPSTSIPNDQGSFQNWLYLIPGKTCKEGNRDACYPATNGASITILSQPN